MSDRAAAFRRLEKLRALADPARGGSPAECRAAARKADKLARELGPEPRARRPRRPRARKPFKPRSTRMPRWTPPDWEFDPLTGEASANVKVHYHTSRGNWKIEVEQ